MLRQGLQQKLLQKLSPQQIQFIKLLQVPTATLEARIEQELEENPALIEGEDPETELDFDIATIGSAAANVEQAQTESNTAPTDNSIDETPGGDTQEISIDQYLQEEEDYRYKTQLQEDPNAERYEAPVVQRNSLFDKLMAQVHLVRLDETEEKIAQQIIGSIDEDGYFRRALAAIVDDLAFRQNLEVTEEQVENVLNTVQQLDPAGVGARDLQECLLLQLDRRPRSLEVEIAQRILMDFFDEFSKKHFDRIIERLSVDRDDFREAYKEITRLNPKPGENDSEAKTHVIVPDYILTVENGEIDIKLNRRNAPDLRVSKGYQRLLSELERKPGSPAASRDTKETMQFVRGRLDAAKWFIDAIRQRQVTLLKTMAAIADKQREFFLTEGDTAHLRPMILKDIADEIGMDISTISRVANSKYVQTDFGIYSLKHFFSEGIATDSGEEVSNKEVKKFLKDYIEAEEKGKPLSDDKLAELLNAKGYNIARRTIAKYREQMNIPVARLRKEV
jgi:RNA polymerase sigma-54 factor